jgi:hypothetical protein
MFHTNGNNCKNFYQLRRQQPQITKYYPNICQENCERQYRSLSQNFKNLNSKYEYYSVLFTCNDYKASVCTTVPNNITYWKNPTHIKMFKLTASQVAPP